MSLVIRSYKLTLALTVAMFVVGCEEKAEKEPAAKPSASAVNVVPPPPPPPPAPPKPRDDCPEGSSGIGTSGEPCKGSGDSRMMEVKWSGKPPTDEGPKFSVQNLTKKSILYGSVAVYFYDKAKKQLQVTHGGKPRPMQLCSGNIFAGAVKPEEKIWVFFSCVKKDHIPEGTKFIEAEMKMVGFADSSGEKNDYYWQNMDIIPDERPMGGVKAKGTAKAKKK